MLVPSIDTDIHIYFFFFRYTTPAKIQNFTVYLRDNKSHFVVVVIRVVEQKKKNTNSPTFKTIYSARVGVRKKKHTKIK